MLLARFPPARRSPSSGPLVPTYRPYLASWRPQHAVAVISTWRGTIRDPLAYLAGRRSSGVVVQCALLSPELRARAIGAPMGEKH